MVLGLAACPKPSPPPPALLRPVEDPVALANPRMGTGGMAYTHGSAFPGAAVPNGMVKVGPDTRGELGDVNFVHYSGYWYPDDTVMGFSHLHLHGTGATDYGIISLMPTPVAVGTQTPAPSSFWSTFSKDSEVTQPGYYAVTLDHGNIRTEITATTRTAHHRYTFPPDATTASVILDLDRTLSGGDIRQAHLEFDDRFNRGQRLVGWVQHTGGMSGGFGGYRLDFVVVSRTRMTPTCWKDGTLPAPVTEEHVIMEGTGVRCALGFDPSQGSVELLVGLSFRPDEAQGNLEAEAFANGGFGANPYDFEGKRAQARAAWSSLLKRMTVYGGADADQRTFYSSLHHAFMMPTIIQDSTGEYLGHDGQEHLAEGFNYVTDLSLWDTYRTLHPLYVLVAPEKARDVVKSLNAMAQQGGFFPKWPIATGEAGTMIGSSAEIILADSYLKGVTDFDAQGAYAILRAAALERTEPVGGRGGRSDVVQYMDLGFCPPTVRNSVSMTLEYAHNDFALAGFARALGHDADADLLMERRKGYSHLWDAQTGFLRAHNADGALTPDPEFAATVWNEHYAEANAWQSVFGMPHDVEGLVALMGGREAVLSRLEEFFVKAREEWELIDPNDILQAYGVRPYYFHGNEPDIHAAYMFSQLGRRDLTARWVDWARTTFHNDGPDGIYGNDDGGTASAWYVFAALGFYPLAGSDRYILGTPLFPRVEISVAGGLFTVEAENAGNGNIYVQRVELNGVELVENEFRHAQIHAGGALRFVMGNSPP